MNIQDLLTKKRHGRKLEVEEIKFFIGNASRGNLDPSQIGAMLMAIAINGMSYEETTNLTMAMVQTGAQLKWNGIVADKHSTGGVGDKVSLPLAPALAACGLTVPMMSGRGLGLTGGTLDKLESIKGFSVSLSAEQMQNCIDKAGCFIASTTKDICPGDKVTYSYRDVTSTVDCPSLIVGSILSKKLAEGAQYLVLDIKAGSAALYKTAAEAEELANLMVKASKSLSLQTRCVITSMDEPIGRAVGNSLEIEEAIGCLQGRGPKDLVELVTHLGAELLMMCNKAANADEGIHMIQNVLNNGEALKRFKMMCICQGVNPADAENLCNSKFDKVLPKANNIKEFFAKESGYVKKIDGLPIAKICWELGSGRKNPEDTLDLSVGVKTHFSAGDQISIGYRWLELHYNAPINDTMIKELEEALEISSTNDFKVPSRIIKVVGR